jgi:dethiobiotin synthetase
MERIVILGTGTAVGKTWTAVALTRALRSRLAPGAVIASKPIETGLSAADATCSDAAQLALAAGMPGLTPAPLYGFSEPLSPYLAARRARARIDPQAAEVWLGARESTLQCNTSTFSIVETAGALFSPLAPGITNHDFARMLEPSRWVLVAPDSLGVLGELTAALIACRARNRLPDHVVLSAARGHDASTGTNATELRTLGIVDPIAVLGPDDSRGIGPLVDLLLRPRGHPAATSSPSSSQ